MQLMSDAVGRVLSVDPIGGTRGSVASAGTALSLRGCDPFLGSSVGHRPCGLAIGGGLLEPFGVTVFFPTFLHGNGLWPRGISADSRRAATAMGRSALVVAAREAALTLLG